MKPIRTLLAATVLLSLPHGPAAQTLQDIDKKEAELVAVWERTPLTVRRALFVTEKPPLYGAFKERSTNVFKPGEPLLSYVEPVGYAWTPSPDGLTFAVTLDFLVKTRDGKVLGGQERFLSTFRRAEARSASSC